MDVLENFTASCWDEFFSAENKNQALQSLESGKILFFPQLNFQLQPTEVGLLSPMFSDGKAKNISFNIHQQTLRGMKASENHIQQLKIFMHRFAKHAIQLVHTLFPSYESALQIGKTSYRPVEILGRKPASYKKDDTRLHVDAFPASPNQGKRILRVFTNINPHGQPRVWRVGEPFEKVAQQFLPRIGKPLISGKLLQAIKLTRGLRTHYDHTMLRLHDLMKADKKYQRQAQQMEIKFPAGTTWIVQTDSVSHAAMSGQYVLEQTFYLPPHAMDNIKLSPLHILETLLNCSLT